MVASRESIPKIDTKLQYPEGLEVNRYLTVFMERIAGWLYIFLGPNVLFHTFLIYFICFFSSLTIFAVFLISREIFKDDFSAIISSIFYTFSIPALGRTIGNYGREDFTLVFLFFSVYFFIIEINKTGFKKFLIAGIWALFMGIGLVSWHLSRFFFVVFLSGVILNQLIFTKCKIDSLKEKFISGLFVLLGFGLGNSFLRINGFILSFPFLLYLSLVIFFIVNKNNLKTSKVLLILLGVVSFLFSSPFGLEYSHIWSLLVNKIKFLGLKPENPLLLPFEARVMWIESFNSPTINFIVYNFFFLFLVSATAVYAFRKDVTKRLYYLLYFVIVFFFFFILVRRMVVFFVFFISVLAGGIFLKSKKPGILFLMVISILFQVMIFTHINRPFFMKNFVAKIFLDKEQVLPDLDVNPKSLFAWIKSSTDENSVFVSDFGFSPNILAYADRKVVIHSKFENKYLRNKVEEFITSIFSSEKDFYKFCKKYDADYFVYSSKLFLDRTNDSYMYVSGNTDITKDMPVFKFQFHPEELQFFTLVYQNAYYRVYRVKDSSVALEKFRVLTYQPIFDLSFYTNDPEGRITTRDISIVINRINEGIMLLRMADILSKKGFLDKAIGTVEKAEEVLPNLVGVHKKLAFWYVSLKNFQESLSEINLEIDNTPFSPQGYYDLGYIYFLMGNYQKATDNWEKSLEIDPNFYPARLNLQQLNRYQNNL